MRAVVLKAEGGEGSGNMTANETPTVASTKGKSPAYKLKTDVYAKVRAALR